MSKSYRYLIPIFIMLLFLGVMSSHYFLKEPFGETDDVERYLVALRTDLLEENWEAAEGSLAALNRAWQLVARRVQFSVERDEVNLLRSNLARLKGYVMAREKAGALAELAEAEEHWEYLGK